VRRTTRAVPDEHRKPPLPPVTAFSTSVEQVPVECQDNGKEEVE
jgi:hypothetical protein